MTQTAVISETASRWVPRSDVSSIEPRQVAVAEPDKECLERREERLKQRQRDTEAALLARRMKEKRFLEAPRGLLIRFDNDDIDRQTFQGRIAEYYRGLEMAGSWLK
jgi:hypothetical protein